MHILAWHIFIFLKSLEKLEDFREKTRVQFLQNLPVQFSKVLPNPIFKRNLKMIFFLLELARFQLSAGQPSQEATPSADTQAPPHHSPPPPRPIPSRNSRLHHHYGAPVMPKKIKSLNLV
jgi:hypothetical protein